MHPDVLILDEPTAGLDPAGRDEILGLLLQMKKDLGITIILVSHVLRTNQTVADSRDPPENVHSAVPHRLLAPLFSYQAVIYTTMDRIYMTMIMI